MVQYEKLYDLVVSENARYCMGYWQTNDSTQDDFDEFLRDVTELFFDGNKLDTKFTAIMVFMKNTHNAKIPWHARLSNLLKALVAILFSVKYESFNSAGELAIAFQSYQDNFDKDVGRKLKEELDFDSTDIANLKSNSPEIVNRIMEGLVSKEPMYLNEVATYLIKID